MNAVPDPQYDVVAAIDTLAPGVIAQREVIDAVQIGYAAGGYKPLTAATVLAALQTAPPEGISGAAVPTLPLSFPVTLPPYPTGLPRFANSNPAPDGYSLDDPAVSWP